MSSVFIEKKDMCGFYAKYISNAATLMLLAY